MHPLALHLTILVAAGAIGVLGHLAAAAAGTTPALRFWEEALPGTPVPDVIADLVQKGIDRSPLVEHYPVTKNGVADGSKINYAYASCRRGCQDKAKQLPAGFYFQQAQVRVGRTMTVYLPAAAPPNPILPRDVASRVPFSNLPDVLAKFNIAPSSADAAVVAADTLSLCEASPPAGEQKACATSLEAIVGGATRMLAGGGRGAVYWAASSALPRAGLPLRQYAVQAVTPLAGDRHVGCHGLPYPYAVYYCHMTGRPTKAYAVTLAGDGGSPPVTMAALCHLDTSNWDPTHPAFEMLHTRPGAAPVCHFMSYANLLFGAN